MSSLSNMHFVAEKPPKSSQDFVLKKRDLKDQMHERKNVGDNRIVTPKITRSTSCKEDACWFTARTCQNVRQRHSYWFYLIEEICNLDVISKNILRFTAKQLLHAFRFFIKLTLER